MSPSRVKSGSAAGARQAKPTLEMGPDPTAEIREMRADRSQQLEALQRLIRIGWGMLLGFISVLAAILARGA